MAKSLTRRVWCKAAAEAEEEEEEEEDEEEDGVAVESAAGTAEVAAEATAVA